jgi:hypothetical protein
LAVARQQRQEAIEEMQKGLNGETTPAQSQNAQEQNNQVPQEKLEQQPQ